MVQVFKQQAASLGIRIGLLFLLGVFIVVLVAYYVLSRNFHSLLTHYSIQLVQAMVNQGVELVEYELETGRKEIILRAGVFVAPEDAGQEVRFPRVFSSPDELRMVYATEERTVASDGRARSVRDRRDVAAALAGETAIYGPYFNEEKEFVICYTAPVRRGGAIIGALSIEKDAYRFCRLIEHIRFADSGESYIINAEGTDIAVSRREHLDWVTSEYNAQKLLQDQEDPVTRSILELEQKGLAGEKGVGTYYWKGSLVHVVYAPVPSVHWVLLGGLREEEIASMTQSVLSASLSKGSALHLCLAVFALLTGLIVFWIFSSLKKSDEINKKLELIANHDSLTGLLNRRFLETSLAEFWKYPIKVSGQAAVFMMDIDNFKKYNDFYGHPKGDDCLRRVSGVFKNAFVGFDGNVIRYGGEEFMAVIFLMDRQSAREQGQKICRLVESERLPDSEGGVVTVSIGVCHVRNTLDASLYECIQVADKALYQAKKSGKNRAVLLDAPLREVSASRACGTV